MRATAKARSDPTEVLQSIQHFLHTAQQPAVLEPGEPPLPLAQGQFNIEVRNGAVTLECWSETKTLFRRVRAMEAGRSDKIELLTEHFGGRLGKLLLVDLSQPRAELHLRQSGRLQYRERFRRSLHRQFADWKLVELSTEQDLHHSLSPSYPRAFLRKGNVGLAAIGASEDCLDPDGALSFGLIWLDYLRQREKKLPIQGLSLFLPAGSERPTCHRVRYLNPNAAQYSVFVHGPDGLEDQVDPRDYTNLDTLLDPISRPAFEENLQLANIPGVEQRVRPNGSYSFLVHGIEIAKTDGGALYFGLDGMRPAHDPSHLLEIDRLAQGLRRLRAYDALDRTNSLYTRKPEAWLESQIRASIQTIDATLFPSPIYNQAPHLAGGERGIIDLLAVDRGGRLAILEIKASQDIHLPLQALDYWIHVKWHLDRDEFTRAGYFPGQALRSERPRLLLVAPALEFHPTNEALLRYLSPEVAAERVGIGLQWRQELEVMFRTPAKVWPSQSYGRSGKRSGI